LDAHSLASGPNTSNVFAEQAIKNPFAPKMNPTSNPSAGKFQWEPAKPAPLTLAQLSQQKSSTLPSMNQHSTFPQNGTVNQQGSFGMPPPSQPLFPVTNQYTMQPSVAPAFPNQFSVNSQQQAYQQQYPLQQYQQQQYQQPPQNNNQASSMRGSMPSNNTFI
jgi:hypothetical protein